MTDEQASDWAYKMICCLGISTSNSDINVVGLHKTVKELYEQGRADEREAQVCCGDYDKCMKACTPRGRWLAEKELVKPEQASTEPPDYVEPPTSDYHNGWEEGFEAARNLYPKKTKREWVGLTNEELVEIRETHQAHIFQLMFAVEAKVREKNT
jgi:hypothetical protein